MVSMGNWSVTVVNACGRLIFLFISHIGRLKIHAQFENITYRVSHFWPGKSACPSAATNFAERHCRILQSLSWLTQSYQWHSESKGKAVYVPTKAIFPLSLFSVKIDLLRGCDMGRTLYILISTLQQLPCL